ncbi:unnamed protein product [Closterium sp. NIES-54]
MYITLYFIVTRLPNSLRSIRDHFLSLDPTSLTVDLLEQHLLVAETSALAVGAARGTPCPPFFEGCPYFIRTGDRAGQTCGRLHTQHRCFSRLDDAWRAEFGDDVDLPRWADLLKSRIAIFDLDFDAILSPMYALSVSAEGDCYRCVPPGLGIAAAALGASESGTLPDTTPAEALHTFTLDSGASRCFFRDNTTLTPLPAPVPVRLADPSGGPVVARSSTVLPCSAVAASCSCRLVSHQTLLWHHRLGHPSLPRLRGMHSRLLVSGLPRSLPPLPPSPAPPCLPCVEGRQRATPHSSSFPPTTAPLQTLLMDRWCILQTFTLPDSPQKNGIAERHIGLVMEVARTSMIHVATPHFLWSFAVQYAAHQLNLWPRVSLPETSPTLRWTEKVGDVSVFRVWGSRAFVRDTSADKLSPRTIPCVFLGFVPDAPGWQFYHPTSRRVFPSQDVTFDEVPSAQVSASGHVAPPCSCRLLSHQNSLWHHRLGHPSLPRLRGMHSRLLVSGLPKSLPPLPPSPAPPCLPCIEGRQRATLLICICMHSYKCLQ